MYLAECYSRAENECSKSGIRKRGQYSEVNDEFNKMKSKIIKECQSAIASKARYVHTYVPYVLLKVYLDLNPKTAAANAALKAKKTTYYTYLEAPHCC